MNVLDERVCEYRFLVAVIYDDQVFDWMIYGLDAPSKQVVSVEYGNSNDRDHLGLEGSTVTRFDVPCFG